MRFTLDGEIIFSKNAENALKDIENFIKQSNQELFLKGIPAPWTWPSKRLCRLQILHKHTRTRNRKMP